MSAVIGIAGPALADALVLPKPVERDSQITAAYRFDKPVTGHGFLDIEWTDVAGREVERRHIPLDLAGASQVAFPLDLRRAATIQNKLTAALSLDGVDPGGTPVHRRDRQVVSFIASPPDQRWWDYQIIMWQNQTPAAWAALKRLGITGGMLSADHRSEGGTYMVAALTPLLDQDLRFYLENIATDFYSPYHLWSGERPVDWRFLAVEALHRQKPDDLTAFIREPSLSDPEWLAKVNARLIRDVRALRDYRPLYYSLGDETGIAELTKSWDFDFSPQSLAAMRDWVTRRYGSLAALNEQWGTHFSGWDQVMPMTTRQAVQVSDENFSAWADFKEWMDVAFARALASGSAAIHAADPDALSAIEGGQIPGWGGYDYSRLAHSVDLIEPYDFDVDIEILRSFNPRLVLLTTLAQTGPDATYRTWREFLRGTRGLILWDSKNEFAAADGSLGERGQRATPSFSAIRGGLGALLINSRRRTDPVAVLYSQPSMRIEWLLDRRARGETDDDEAAGAEQLGAGQRISSRNFVRAMEHIGLEPRFISTRDLEQGDLRAHGYRVLMLPHTVALSPVSANEIRDFVARGGVVVADGEPGQFDEHGRRTRPEALADIFTARPSGATSRFAFGNGSAIYLAFGNADDDSALIKRVRQVIAAAGVEFPSRETGTVSLVQRVREVGARAGLSPPFPIAQADGTRASDIETHIFDNGPATILAVQRDLPQEADPARGEVIAVSLPRRLNVYNLLTQRALGETDRVTIDLDPGQPAILALSPKPLAAPEIDGPVQARLGENAEFSIRVDPAEAPGVIHVEVTDPSGRPILHYSGNILAAARGAAVKLLPLALNDQSGIWKIRATDVLSGQTATAELKVER